MIFSFFFSTFKQFLRKNEILFICLWPWLLNTLIFEMEFFSCRFMGSAINLRYLLVISFVKKIRAWTRIVCMACSGQYGHLMKHKFLGLWICQNYLENFWAFWTVSDLLLSLRFVKGRSYSISVKYLVRLNGRTWTQPINNFMVFIIRNLIPVLSFPSKDFQSFNWVWLDFWLYFDI